MKPGQVVWVEFDPVAGREQGGRRPAVIISRLAHIRAATTLVTVVPCTTTDRGWRNHIRITGPTSLRQPTFAMTEQQRTISRTRIRVGDEYVDAACLTQILDWVHQWIEPESLR